MTGCQSDETLSVGIKKRIWRHKNCVRPQLNRVSEGSFDLGGLADKGNG